MSIGVYVETLPVRIVFCVHCRRLSQVLRQQEVVVSVTSAMPRLRESESLL
ncbi:hypothetical protein [Xanthomonas phaseoli]|uniref:hypothetical protein n=1 Tax=Xanthomonas phaseoli TaxID=1985254 RepID=UPI000305097B|nr:hypothetical protein [Xanthomonas phaseoli]MBO9851957.1 hypothetical protein [Xanthomonas phaseoli pv. dieffenbachiae]MBO9860027.1 hypothetical protein [Xanthomonas phaseoli pv. dieffenbachiae]MBO9902214.1 hypothetical protein [Xanthomonas phaseoli pv. dieffenbachiae]MBO9938126.1 hypothetical protein [Xanthomonas phaseoli pv. dieffenbachiae]MBO9986307.1 hypothetical protein [Xanthomonas phaseoli pv. dieffenbachiae]